MLLFITFTILPNIKICHHIYSSMDVHTKNGIAGATQASLVTIVGYPCDLIKSRLQTGLYGSSSWNTFTKTVQKEGLGRSIVDLLPHGFHIW